MNQDTESRDYLVWSYEHKGWWVRRLGGNWGYTRDVNEAGRYTESEATRICENAKRYSDWINERAVKLLELESFLKELSEQ
jgi:hypothetical protein